MIIILIMIRILWVILFGFFPFAMDQSADSIAKDLNNAIQSGNSRSMSRYFGQNVELFIPGSEGTFSKAQTEVILRDFFSKNPPDTLMVSRQGALSDGSLYVIGSMKTKDGNYFRTYYLIKRVSRSYFLHQLQIEPR